MMAKSEKSEARPIVLQIQAGNVNPIAIEAALRLAEVLEKDFESIFVEDDDLLSLASLPFAREITATGRRSRSLSTAVMEREMRAASSAARRKIEALAKNHDVKTEFRVVRDAPGHAMREAGERAGILVLGQPVTSSGRREIRSLVACLDGVPACLLVGERVTRAKGRVIALIDDPTRSGEIIATAARFGATGAGDFSVLVTRDALDAREEIATQLAEIIGPGERVRIEGLRDDEPGQVAQSVRQLGGGLLIAGFGGRLISDEPAVTHLTISLQCPLLLLRCGTTKPVAA